MAKSGNKCPEPEVHLLGEIVVWFGKLEFFLETAIWNLLTPEADEKRFVMAQAMTAGMSFRLKVDAFDRVFRLKGIASAESELKALVVKLNSAATERDKLVHSYWNYSSLWGGRDFMRVKLPRSTKDVNASGVHRRDAEPYNGSECVIGALRHKVYPNPGAGGIK